MNCILTIIKNEQFYLEEWIRYHCELGFDTLFIIEDIGSESHKHITDKYPNVMLKDASELNEVRQAARLNEVYHSIIKHKYDWCLLIDVDEFVTFDNCNLNNILEKYKDDPYIWLQWHNYGANGLINKPIYDRPIFDIYTKRCGNRDFDISFNKTGKMMYNCKLYNDHLFLHWLAFTIEQNEMYIRHYITKSWEEWKWKIEVRGMHNPNNRKLEDFFVYNPDMLNMKDILLK